MMLTDTDSLVYEIKTENVYEEFYENKNLFDFRDYAQDSMELHSKFFDLGNKKFIGKVKD